mgnify:CR=1 FL=1
MAPLLIFGGTGQVGRELQRRVPDATFSTRQTADLTQPEQIEAFIYESAPRAIINAAAYTNVDQAEESRDLALSINGLAPGVMAEVAAELEVPLVHISTDYVFDGAGDAPWTPEDPTGPLGEYGLSKLAGEREVQKSGGTYAILRTSWVFSAHGKNFVKTMLRLAEKQNALEIVNDQFGGPTSAASIAEACVIMADALIEDASRSGIYHFAGHPVTNWSGGAREIFSKAGTSVGVSEVSTEAFPTKAQRPLNSRLDCVSTRDAFGIVQSDWRKDLANVLQELSADSEDGP